jgi:hypothetical protein
MQKLQKLQHRPVDDLRIGQVEPGMGEPPKEVLRALYRLLGGQTRQGRA